MSKLSAAQRNALPAKDFAGPGRSYPIEDKNHAQNAIARAHQQQKAGNLSSAQEEKIEDKAYKKLGKKAPHDADDKSPIAKKMAGMVK